MNALRGIWRLLNARQRRRFVVLQFVSLIMAGATLTGLAALVPFLMVLADPGLIGRDATLAAVFHALGFADRGTFLVALGVAFVAAVVLGNVVNLLGSHAMTRFALSVGDHFHAALLGEYLRRDCAFHARVGGAELFNRVVYSVNRVASGLIESALLFITHCVVALCIVATILLVNPVVAAFAALWLGGSYLAVYALARRKLYRNGLLEGEMIARRARYANESLRAIREVQVLGKLGYFRDAFGAACRAISRVVAVNHLIAQAPRYALESITVAGLVGAALVLSRGRGVGEWLAELTFIAFAALRLMPALQQMFAAVVRIRANEPMFDQVADDLDAALRDCDAGAGPAAAPDGRWAGAPRREIRLDAVSFRYAADSPPALSAVSLSIPAGAMVGIVGANGSGKSTLVDIVAGLLAPDEGRVCVDDLELDARSLAAWRQALAYAPQDVVLLDATLAENVAFGELPGDVDRARLERAAHRARLDALLRRLPAGFDTRVGEGGATLSGGERQRVSLARALYRDARVLLLDEPSSALDGFTEAELADVLRDMRGHHTILVVAHRPAIIRECDRVYALEHGALVAAGSPAEVARLAAGRSAAAHADLAQPAAQGRVAQRAP